LMRLIAEAEAMKAKGVEDVEGVIGTSMDERDVARLIAWPYFSMPFHELPYTTVHNQFFPLPLSHPHLHVGGVDRARSQLNVFALCSDFVHSVRVSSNSRIF
jgi:hypothetical protein